MKSWQVIICCPGIVISSVQVIAIKEAESAQDAAFQAFDRADWDMHGWDLVAVVEGLTAVIHPRDDNRTAEFGVG